MISGLIVGVVLGILSNIFLAIQNVVVKYHSATTEPVFANSIKLWASLLVMTSIAILPLRPDVLFIPATAVLPLVLSVTFGGTLGEVIYFTSQKRVGVSIAFPIAMTYPLFTYAITIVFLGEAFIPFKLIGALLTVSGITLISRSRVTDEDTPEEGIINADRIGVGLAVIASLFYAIATVNMQIGVETVNPIDAAYVRMLAGSFIMIPLFLVERRRTGQRPPPRAVKYIAAVSVFGYAIGSLMYVASIKLIGATVGSIIGSTGPLFAIPFSIVILEESINTKIAVGTILTLLGIWVAIV